MQPHPSTGGNSRRILATLGVLGAIGALTTFGTYSLFTDSVVAGPQTIASGTVDIALGTAQPNRLTVGATNVAPGDTIQRAVDITNTAGGLDFASVSLTTAATTSSLLDTDATNGLQMVVDKCSAAWSETPVGAGFTYTCSGTTSSVIASRQVIGSTLPLGALASLTAGNTDHLRVTLTLPATANNTFQGKSSTIQYTFDATQRAATNK
jgi:predicted ribosomally synthesized peptide with SipW-like signal peptide